MTTYKLKSGVKANRLHPATFEIPPASERESVEPGNFVKLMFDGGDGVERMWVLVTDNNGDTITGTLANNPFFTDLAHGDLVTFKPKHIIDILEGVA